MGRKYDRRNQWNYTDAVTDSGSAEENRSTIVVGSCPLDCPDACAWLVTVDEPTGAAIKIRGNPHHPITAGELCKKVNPWLSYAADPTRLVEPLRRVGPKGSGEFEPIAWDDAIAEIAERWSAIISRSGGQAIWPYVSTGHQGWIQGSNAHQRLFNRMGAITNHSSICAAGGFAGMSYSLGAGGWTEPEEFAEAGLIICWGTNTKVTNRHLWPFIEQARGRGAKLVVVDPVGSRTAEAADLHLALKPGTDGALALGLMNAIVDAGGADKRFLHERCLGWDEFAPTLADWTPQRVADVCGIDATQVTALATDIVDARQSLGPLAIRMGHGMQRHAHGGQAMRVVACLPAITGAYDQVGGGVLYSLYGDRYGFNLDASRRPDLGTRARTLATTNLAMNLRDLDPPVESIIFWGANPVDSNPDTLGVRSGLSREDLFTVVIDLFPTATTAYADIVLPSTMQHEHLDITGSYHHRYIQWNEPAVEPPGQCLPHTEIFRRLAEAMGYDDPAFFGSDEEFAADLLSSQEMGGAGISVESLRSAGYLPMPDRPGSADRPFGTTSGLFEFVSARAEADGHGLLPNFRSSAEAARPAPGHLALIAAASDHHVNSTFAGTKTVLGRGSQPQLWIHPDDAGPRNITDGAEVELHNERGSARLTAVVTDRTRRGVAATTKGWWGLGLNNTILERDADMASGARFHDNAVLVRPVEP